MYNSIKNGNNTDISTKKNGEKRMTVDDRNKKTFINKLLFAFKSKRSIDIVAYADKIIDDYTGLTALRSRRRERQLKKVSIIVSSASAIVFLCILLCTFKIFF